MRVLFEIGVWSQFLASRPFFESSLKFSRLDATSWRQLLIWVKPSVQHSFLDLHLSQQETIFPIFSFNLGTSWSWENIWNIPQFFGCKRHLFLIGKVGGYFSHVSNRPQGWVLACSLPAGVKKSPISVVVSSFSSFRRSVGNR